MMTLYVQGSNSVLARPELIPTLLRRIAEGVCSGQPCERIASFTQLLPEER